MLNGWCKAPMLTAWSTPNAALLVSGLQGVALTEAVGVFTFANALIVLCGMTSLLIRSIKITPHSLAAIVLVGILLRFGLQAFAGLQEHLLLYGGMPAAWFLCKALWPRFTVVTTLVVGALITAAPGGVSRTAAPLAFAAPEWIAPQLTPALLLSVGLPFFPVTMTSQSTPGFVTLQTSGYAVPVSALLVICGGLALLLASFGVYSICVTATTAAICQSPEVHPDPQQRWLAVMAAGGFHLLTDLFGRSVTALMSALSAAWVQILAGLVLFSTIGGSLFQAVHQISERDAVMLTFPITANDVTLTGIGSAFWGVVLGGVSYGVLSVLRCP